jgi:tRNA-Thr(GGU) m(6)t(6)A37 methyltransferase TsaA
MEYARILYGDLDEESDRTSQLRVELKPIGVARSPFKEKFGIPRQPGLVPSALGCIELNPDPDLTTAVRTLEQFSHLWLVFLFHKHDSRNWKPSIRPPRLGGAKKVGSLASRSPHRPNPIGLSAVRMESIELPPRRSSSTKGAGEGPKIWVSGLDLLDGTPILDLKPYIKYTDSIESSVSGWAEEKIERHPVDFSKESLEQIIQFESSGYPNLKSLIEELLALDPRPAALARKDQAAGEEQQRRTLEFGFNVLNWDVQWRVIGKTFRVERLADLHPPKRKTNAK